MTTRRTAGSAALALMATLFACADDHSPTAPLEGPPAPAFDRAASNHLHAIEGFRFLSPIVAGAERVEDPDASLLDLLAVEICELDGDACAGPPVRRITAQSGPPSRLHVSGNGMYAGLWNTAGDALDPDAMYRIRVLASGGELAHADVDVVKPGGGASTDGTQYVRVVEGSTVPIHFMIASGIGARADSEGGIIELAGGAVTLDLPPGALPGDIFLTAVPATGVPTGDPPIVPGTAWDFGPDGLVFLEPVVMTIRYDPADIPAGVEESELRIHKVVDGAFEQQDAGLVDLVEHTVSAEVESFSVFVVVPRDPLDPEDIVAPDVRALEVLNPSTGTFGSSTTIDVSGSDATVTTRLHITDDKTGVLWIDVRYRSPSGRQMRFPCYTGDAPTTGGDTNGEWICSSVFPRHAEAGTWSPQLVFIRDRVENRAFYQNRSGGFCDQFGNCIDSPAEIVVTSAAPDLDAPVLQSFGVSLDVQPRMFGPSVSVDVGAGPRTVYFGFQATDDLSGTGVGLLPFDGFQVNFTGPSNQTQFWGSCNLTQGTPLDGFWECFVNVPAQAETGTWRVTFLRVPDRAGNGGFSGFDDYRPDGTGQLCRNNSGTCVSAPTVEVTSAGDGQPPALQTLDISAVGADVTTSLGVTDDLSGVSFIRVTYQSAVTTQIQECFPPLASGSPTDGTWSCTITFSPFAARGQWTLSLQLFDQAGNTRFYSRRPSDGFLCYFDGTTGMQVCQDFGDTDLILQ